MANVYLFNFKNFSAHASIFIFQVFSDGVKLFKLINKIFSWFTELAVNLNHDIQIHIMRHHRGGLSLIIFFRPNLWWTFQLLYFRRLAEFIPLFPFFCDKIRYHLIKIFNNLIFSNFKLQQLI